MKKPKKPRKTKRKPRYKGPPAAKGKNKKSVWLNVLPQDMLLKVKHGVNLWETLRERDVGLEGECGGLGKCGKCKIRVITAIGPPSAETAEVLSPEELKKGIRLACREKVKKNLVVSTEVYGDEVKFFQILKHGQMPIIQLDPLLDKQLANVPPPSREDPSSDLERLRKALGPEYHSLNLSYRCVSSLYEDLRNTQFEGTAVVHDRDLLAWQPRRMAARRYGLVFDIGTSTLVASLVSLLDGQGVAVVSCLNSQNRHGSNVISRIQYIKEHPRGLSQMRKYLIQDLNILIRRLLQAVHLAKEDIFIAVAAGNTTMQHILFGMNPSGIAEAPFAPVTNEAMIVRAQDVGLDLHPEAVVHIMPSKSGYIGGDLLAFVLASGSADEKDRMVLGLDFGTNGEIFLGNRDRMLTCSAAAGPALEGAKIDHGMIAKAGAIEGFRFADNGLRYQVIGNIKPKGLCGSGLVDLVALLLHHDLVDPEGLMSPMRKSQADYMASRLLRRDGREVYDFLVASPKESFGNRRIYLTQNDVRELQLAKGAIAAGVNILMEEIGVQIGDIDVVYLAGALGNYVNPFSAMRIGLIPNVDPEKIIPLGNAASTGARMVLLSRQNWNKSTEIAQFIEHVELSTHPNLFDYFVKEMSFPTENLW
jgi:uncharacterized 2Fe-2S/4Fe-4S cluster protein (DUF4445 family)